MDSHDYNRIKELIETRFRQDMAALERVWFTINGANPPDSPIAFSSRDTQPAVPVTGAEPMRSAAELGIPTADAIDARTAPRAKRNLSPEAIAKRSAYMKAYWAKRRKAKAS